MYILEQIGIGELSDERLSFFRAIGVDSVHLELRGGKPQAGAKVRSTGAANSTLAQALPAGYRVALAPPHTSQARLALAREGMILEELRMECIELVLEPSKKRKRA